MLAGFEDQSDLFSKLHAFYKASTGALPLDLLVSGPENHIIGILSYRSQRYIGFSLFPILTSINKYRVDRVVVE